MREATLEKKLRLGVEAKGGMCLKWTSPSYKGVPDRIVFMPNGRIWFVEVKRPGGRISPAQMHCLNRLYNFGFKTEILWTDGSINEFLCSL